jgi:hypothetical protein
MGVIGYMKVIVGLIFPPLPFPLFTVIIAVKMDIICTNAKTQLPVTELFRFESLKTQLRQKMSANI